jgi:hypothetical protein
MKAFLASLVAVIVISAGAAAVLNVVDRSAESVFSSGNVRL